MLADDIRARVGSVPYWFHSIDFGQGVIAPGFKTPHILKREVESFRIPDLRGRSVLDINTWDGYYAFEAERRGADRVVALDQYMWQMDQAEHSAYWAECKRLGKEPKPYHVMPYFRPDTLPGKLGFDTAKELMGSKVEAVVGDFMDMDLTLLGKFDVVFFLGTLYHMEDPLRSVRRLAEVTGGMAIIETEAVALPGREHQALCEFFPSGELNSDSSNWWAPNAKALAGMCQAAGFQRVEILVGPPVSSRSLPRRLRSSAGAALRTLRGADHTGAAVGRYRAVAHAYM